LSDIAESEADGPGVGYEPEIHLSISLHVELDGAILDVRFESPLPVNQFSAVSSQTD